MTAKEWITLHRVQLAPQNRGDAAPPLFISFDAGSTAHYYSLPVLLQLYAEQAGFVVGAAVGRLV